MVDRSDIGSRNPHQGKEGCGAADLRVWHVRIRSFPLIRENSLDWDIFKIRISINYLEN